MNFKSVNPFDGQELAEYQAHTDTQTLAIIESAGAAYESWRLVSLEKRCALISKVGELLLADVDAFAKIISLEMGKPISESRAEVNKCASVCDYYAVNASAILADEVIATDATESFVRHDPIGCVIAVMPWNFPFWQVFRFAAPTLTAGNVGLLKHAPNVFGCSEMIVDVFNRAGYPEGVFQHLIIHHDKVKDVIGNDVVKAVTLTGSERAGSAVAEAAGKYLKKTVMELGGNNAFIVLDDADIEKAVKTALTARMLNCGQSCIAAKRFILIDSVYDRFIDEFTDAVSKLKSGNPLEDDVTVGPLARKDLADQLQKQVNDTVKKGAELLFGGEQNECYHEPTILGKVTPGMPAFDEETFGPLAAMIKAADTEDAYRLAGRSAYGLGLTVCTRNIAEAKRFARRVNDGAYFINELVKSDPRLPFGGTRRSGYGRELAKDGMLEFVNRKTVYVK